jgi:hypothetical protein
MLAGGSVVAARGGVVGRGGIINRKMLNSSTSTSTE